MFGIVEKIIERTDKGKLSSWTWKTGGQGRSNTIFSRWGKTAYVTPRVMLHTSMVTGYLKACFVENPVKNHRWKQQWYILCLELNDCAQSFVCVYKSCPNELMRFLNIGHWFTGGRGNRGSKPPHSRTLNSRLPRLFPWLPPLSLDLALVVCKILNTVV